MKIIHISDLHFGAEDFQVASTLLLTLKSIKYDLLIVSGDLTQRGLPGQFKAAKSFLEQIDRPKLIVPGNHDISFFNLLKRAVDPFADYKKFITSDLMFEYHSNHMLILGLNSANPWHGKNGKLSRDSLTHLVDFFRENTDKPKILVLHHNLFKLPGLHPAITNRRSIMSILSAYKIDIILSGHLHVPHVKKEFFSSVQHSAYFITAGTAISKRLRNFVNSFNYLEIKKDKFTLQFYDYSAGGFLPKEKNVFSFSRGSDF